MIAEGTSASERASERRRWRETGERGRERGEEDRKKWRPPPPPPPTTPSPLRISARFGSCHACAQHGHVGTPRQTPDFVTIYMFFPWDDLWACVLITMSRFTENDPRCSVPSLPPNMRITSDARATSGEERGAPYANDRRKEGRKEGASSFYEWVGWAGQGTLSSTRLAIPTSPEVAANLISKLRSSFHSPLRNERPNYVKSFDSLARGALPAPLSVRRFPARS